MDILTVQKSTLVAALKTNREQHTAKVEAARVVYRQKIVEELDRRLAEARNGRDVDPLFLHRLPIPRDYTLEYDRALQQLEWEVNDTVELSTSDFNRLVRDEWEWAGAFTASTQAYLGD